MLVLLVQNHLAHQDNLCNMLNMLTVLVNINSGSTKCHKYKMSKISKMLFS